MALAYKPTAFGLMLDYPLPPDCDAVIVCVDLGTGHEPVRLSLPHQVYRETLQRLREKYPAARSFTLLPYRTADKIKVPLSAIADQR